MDAEKKKKLQEKATAQSQSNVGNVSSTGSTPKKEGTTAIPKDSPEYQEFLEYERQQEKARQQQKKKQQQEFQEFQQFQQYQQQQNMSQQQTAYQQQTAPQSSSLNGPHYRRRRQKTNSVWNHPIFGIPTKRWILTVVVILIGLSLYGLFMLWYSGRDNTPEHAVTAYLNGLDDQIRTTVNEKEDMADTSKELALECLNTGNDLQYEITNLIENEDSAVATVKFTYRDHSGILSDVLSNYLANGISEAFSSAFSGEDFTDDDANRIMMESIQTALENEEYSSATDEVNIPCIKTNGKWQIGTIDDSLSNTLVNIYLGNAVKSISDLGFNLSIDISND